MISRGKLLECLREIWRINQRWNRTKRIGNKTLERLDTAGASVCKGRKSVAFFKFDGKVAVVSESGYKISRSNPVIELTP